MGILQRIFGGAASPTSGVNCANGNFAVEVVGESNYQQALRAEATRAVGGQLPVKLVPEPSNKYDGNAVRVCTSRDQTLGYLPRDMAEVVQPAIARFRATEHSWPSCTGKLVGLETGKTLGIWLDLDLFRLGIGPKPRPVAAPTRPSTYRPSASPGFRSGLSAAVATDEEDDSYDLSWMARLADDMSDIRDLRQFLTTDPHPISRHYLFCALERQLYRARDAFASAADEFDNASREHDAEMDGIRQALVLKFGKLPLLETYKLAAIRHSEAGDLQQVISWAQRGIDLYGDLAADPIWSEDLAKRRDKANAKLAKAAAKNK